MEQNQEYLSRTKEREEKIGSQLRRKQFIRAAWWIVGLSVLALAGYGIWRISYDPTVAVEGEYFKSQGQDHIAVGASHPDYSSNPPTSGWHYAQPAQSGIYDTELPDEQLIHNLEHGHIWIAYKPDIPADQIEQLAEIAKSYGSKMIMTSRANNDTPIAIVAWEYVLKLDAFDEAQIKGFIKAHRGKGPESIPDFGFKDFRTGQ